MAGPGDDGRINTRRIWQGVGPRSQRHHHLFQCAVASPLADAVDGAFDLASTCVDRRQRIGHGQAQIVVAVYGEHCLVDVRHAVEQHRDELGEFARYGVADRVGNIDRRRAGPDSAFDDAAQKIGLAARTVFGRPFDVGAQVTRIGHTVDDCLVDFFRVHLQFHPHMQRAGRQNRVDARLGRTFEGFPGTVDILDRRAG